MNGVRPLEPAVKHIQARPWRGAGATMLRRFAYAADRASQVVAEELSSRSNVDYSVSVERLVERDPTQLREVSRVVFDQAELVSAAADHAALAVSRSPYSHCHWTTRMYAQVQRLDSAAQKLHNLPFIIHAVSQSDREHTVLDNEVAATSELLREFVDFNHDLKLRVDQAELLDP